MKRYFNIVNGVIVPLPEGNETGLYSIECKTDQEFLSSGSPDQLVFENDAIRWKTEQEDEREKLDSVISLSKLAILEALDDLSDERAKFDVLMQNALFKERWDASTALDMNHPLTIQGLAQVGFDIDAVKRNILGIG